MLLIVNELISYLNCPWKIWGILVKTITTEFIGKLSNCNVQWTKPSTRIISNISHFFFILFEAIKRFLWEPEKTNFQSFKFHKMRSYAWRFYLCFLNSWEIWNLFSWPPIRKSLVLLAITNYIYSPWKVFVKRMRYGLKYGTRCLPTENYNHSISWWILS